MVCCLNLNAGGELRVQEWLRGALAPLTEHDLLAHSHCGHCFLSISVSSACASVFDSREHCDLGGELREPVSELEVFSQVNRAGPLCSTLTSAITPLEFRLLSRLLSRHDTCTILSVTCPGVPALSRRFFLLLRLDRAQPSRFVLTSAIASLKARSSRRAAWWRRGPR